MMCLQLLAGHSQRRPVRAQLGWRTCGGSFITRPSFHDTPAAVGRHQAVSVQRACCFGSEGQETAQIHVWRAVPRPRSSWRQLSHTHHINFGTAAARKVGIETEPWLRLFVVITERRQVHN